MKARFIREDAGRDAASPSSDHPREITPRIAVVIPAHNEGRNMLRTLDDLRHCNYPAGLASVFVIADNKLTVRELQVGERLGDRIEIVSGVKEGEHVATTDVDTLADGAAVTVK